MAYLVGVLIALVVLLGSIALHEVGHMVPAKRFGVRVSHYFVGFGPTLWSRTRGETEYGVKAVPLGGFVRLVGMYAPAEAVGNPPARTWMGRLAADARDASAAEIHPGEDHRAFYRLSTPKKLVVMLGGPVMNLLIAFVLLAIVLMGFGVPATTTTLDSVSQCVIPAGDADRACTDADEAAPGAAAGFLPGDTVVSWAGTPVSSWDELSTLIRATGAEPTDVVVERDGAQVDLSVTPVVAQRPTYDEDGAYVYDEDGALVTEPVGFVGVSPSVEYQAATLAQVPGALAERTWQTVTVVATLPARVVDLVQTTFGDGERGTDSIVGIVGVGRLAGEVASVQGEGIDWGLRFAMLLEMLAALNIALFVFNLIPLPPLDGGHVAAALWEGAKRQVARVRRLPRPGPFDSAKLVPLAYSVFVVLGAMGLLLVYADIVDPVSIT